MGTSRLLLLSLLISLCVATAAAQVSPRNSEKPLPAPAPNGEAGLDLFQFQLTADSEFNPMPAARSDEHEDDSMAVSSPEPRMPHIVTLEQNDATCYSIRAYRVVRQNPDSDAVRPAGYSTCIRSSRFQLKTAVDSREIAPR